MTDDLTSGGPTNHLSHSPHHNQKASSGVPNGQATFIGRRPSVRSKLKVASDLHELDDIRIAPSPLPAAPPSSSHYQVPSKPHPKKRVCAVHGGGGGGGGGISSTTTTTTTASAISRRTV